MRSPHILQIINLMDADLQLPGLHDAEEIAGVVLEFLARHDVVHEG